MRHFLQIYTAVLHTPYFSHYGIQGPHTESLVCIPQWFTKTECRFDSGTGPLLQVGQSF